MDRASWPCSPGRARRRWRARSSRRRCETAAGSTKRPERRRGRASRKSYASCGAASMVDMMTRRSLAAAVLVLVAAAPVAAGEPTDRLRTFIERANRVILAPEADGGLDERVSAVRALVTEVFDFEGAAALALGRHWASLPPPARVAFTRLYADVVERGYLAWVGSKARVGEGGVSIRWLEERVEPDAATVTSVLLTRTG